MLSLNCASIREIETAHEEGIGEEGIMNQGGRRDGGVRELFVHPQLLWVNNVFAFVAHTICSLYGFSILSNEHSFPSSSYSTLARFYT